ncbi:MAG: ABC transporter permease [Actinomycetota bacterium]|jgi:ABC-2 type transport system permease protein|nr:ABC transporter permease [Actinomycetota bacterium]
MNAPVIDLGRTGGQEWKVAPLWGRLVGNEVAKGLWLLWRRRAMALTTAVAEAVVYLGVSLFIGGGHIVRPLMVLTLPALLASVVAVSAALGGSGGIAEEINAGTLEQSQLGLAPPELQVLGRFCALAVEGLVIAAMLGVAFTLGFGLSFHVGAGLVVPAVLSVIGALGYGLVITGLTVRMASIGAVTHVANMAVQFFGGMLVPVALFPAGLETFARFLPITLGVEALDASLGGRSLASVWASGTLPLLVAYAAGSFGLGMAVYSTNVRRARRQGGLSSR